MKNEEIKIRIARASDAQALSTVVKSLAHFYLDEPKNEVPN
ncbi:hypothetical protein [Agaribacter flavus]|uniref:GNAT family N-acetyltransferase n=1 Tax=Agaribacter flavus TaxID=1902781 RepID=A0ABV7FJQ9_9ALTE